MLCVCLRGVTLSKRIYLQGTKFNLRNIGLAKSKPRPLVTDSSYVIVWWFLRRFEVNFGHENKRARTCERQIRKSKMWQSYKQGKMSVVSLICHWWLSFVQTIIVCLNSPSLFSKLISVNPWISAVWTESSRKENFFADMFFPHVVVFLTETASYRWWMNLLHKAT